MSAIAPDPTLTDLSPRRLDVGRGTMMVEGHVLVDVALAGYQLGRPLGTAPVVIIVGGITATPFPFGDAASGAAAWWSALRADDLVDLSRHTVLTFCWPGNGSTWKGFDDPELAYPPLSALGLADLLAAWLDGIGGAAPATFIGASLGGLVGIAFAARHPGRCARLVTISAGLRPDGWGTATRHLQRELVRDGQRTGDVAIGMIRARQLGMLTYRGRDELDTRFGVLDPGLERPPVAAYLDHHGQRFAERFPVRTFLMLSEAIDRSHFGTDPTSMRAELARVTADTLVVGVPGDLLFPYALQHELYRELQAVGASVALWKLDSEFGHDAFLADQDRLAALLRDSGFFAEIRPAVRRRYEGVGSRPIREIRIGLIGCGVVGSGVLELLERQEAAMAERYRVRFRVTRLAVRDASKARPARAAGIPRVARPIDLVADPEVDVIVEVAGGHLVEETLVAALAAGKPVVTANKALLARKLGELGAIAQRTETPLLCEAAAAAAIPIIRHLSHRADEVDSLMAIVNGTCNYVITRMEQDELPLDRAIAEAQSKGFAEADPSADIGGHDAAAKLSILAYRAFGSWVPPNELAVRGIGELWPADCDLAEAMGFKIRLIAHATRIGDGLTAAVEPLLLPDWHLLASVEEEYNAVYLKCASSGDLSLFGKGAGALPTATAVLGDLIELAQDNSVQWPAPRPLAVMPAPSRRHYLRVSGEPHPGLARRVDSLVRRAGLSVQNRAARTEANSVHHGFVISPSSDAEVASLCARIRELGRVEQTLWFGVAE
ncbi:MAG: homoserine dehydrogenase [Proteobacteria bacterium]|nr:homoserine dehydrogenase [Pseudomonadota bacterium]